MQWLGRYVYCVSKAYKEVDQMFTISVSGCWSSPGGAKCLARGHSTETDTHQRLEQHGHPTRQPGLVQRTPPDDPDSFISLLFILLCGLV